MSEPYSPLPDEFVKRLKQIVPPQQLASILKSFHQVKPTSFRINTLRNDPEQIKQQLQDEGFDLQPGETVLDLAAAPGGKTLQMA
ncbi:hypothetical protein [Spartinivicinus marinus]|uniref:hypothetical protein n=1 Tax=Spartinivicinus marinus TaxID=2994442 RepID=UPI001C5CA86A|nr:hypothetical protein [Spartinivicinus marinus]MCX4027067.1 hypothetical protein [Spartinivicinus marinus]